MLKQLDLHILGLADVFHSSRVGMIQFCLNRNIESAYQMYWAHLRLEKIYLPSSNKQLTPLPENIQY
jgi:hypothetical protein